MFKSLLKWKIILTLLQYDYNTNLLKKGSNKRAPQKTNTLSCITDRGNK